MSCRSSLRTPPTAACGLRLRGMEDLEILGLGVKPTGPTRTVAGDADGKGQEEFLVGLADGTLMALAERREAPQRLWSVGVDAAIREIVLADVDGDGASEIVIKTDDGKVRLLGPK